jgi:hypothetical protein
MGSSQEGWSNANILLLCLGGRTSDELKRGDPTLSAAPGNFSTSEGVAKAATGAVIGEVLTDRFAQLVQLDVAKIEFGTSSVDVKLCKGYGRRWKVCGQGEVSFIAGNRVGGSLELKVSDYWSAVGRYDYLTRGLDTLQDSRSAGRLELRLRLPLLH